MAKFEYINGKPVISGIKTIFFDLDGTLVDSLGVWRYTDKLFFKEHGMAMPEDFIEKTNAMRYEETVRYAVSIVKPKEDLEYILKTWKLLAIHEYETTVPLKEGVYEYLEYLYNKGIQMYIVTSGDKEMYDPCIKRLKIDKFFKGVFSANEVGIGKQSGKIYSYALAKTNTKIEDALLFEDALDAIQSANNLGILTIGIQDENNPPLKNANIPNHIVYTFKNAPLIADYVK